MRSGNGRHRRPRQAPALLVTVGVTGAGFALPLLGATGAQAADADTWDRVADCESGGVWSTDAGNGRYGGLQISLKTWVAYGGEAYASQPDLASRSQQIAVAERILGHLGPDAWVACAERSGLTEDSTAVPDLDPGASLPPLEITEAGAGEGDDAADADGDTTDPSGSNEPTEPSQTPEADEESSEPKPSDSPSPSDSASPSDLPSDADSGSDSDSASPSESPDATDSSTETGDPSTETEPSQSPGAGEEERDSTGKHRGERDAQDAERERELERQRLTDRQQWQEGDSADRDGRETRDDVYQVQPGDSLWAIAERHDLPGGWSALHEVNQDVVGGDPDLILPGQLLDLDAAQR